MIGAVPGIEVGAWFEDRAALRAAGAHRPTQAGICGSAEAGAESVVLNGGYPDDADGGDVILYTGAGGQDAGGKHVRDQTLNRTNLALVTSLRLGLPVRVIRGSRLGPPLAPESGYRYDGLYRVTDYWPHEGRDGFRVWMFRLEQVRDTVIYDMPAAARVAESPGLFGKAPRGAPAPRVEATVSRIVRDTAVTRRVKEIHRFRCQMCDARVETPAGPYAEAAHIRPLGRPHDGPDVLANVLCLCPTHHAAFDLYGVGIAADGRLLGMPGRLRTVPAHALDADCLVYRRRLFDAAHAEAARDAA